MKQSWHKRTGLLALAALVGWLTWATPVAWAGCTAMSLHMPSTECNAGTGCRTPMQQMQEGCLLQLGGFSQYVAAKPVSLHLPPPLAPPPAPLEALLRQPQVLVLAPFTDTSPPPRPRPLRLYYSVFLK